MHRNLEPPTSLSLIRGLAQMDAAAWERFVDVYGPVVYSRCRSFGLSEADAEDLTQVTLTKVFRGIGRFSFRLNEVQTRSAAENPDVLSGTGGESSGFRRWLRTVTANSVRDFFRAQRQRFASWDQNQLEAIAALFLTSDFDPRVPADTVSLYFPRAGNETTALIAAALRARRKRIKKEKNWQAFWRTTMEGQSTEQVAEDLGMTPKAVRQARYETIHELRTELAGLIDFDNR
ncbi:MAG: sigma-70 family RNA polymerase sigma factor [Planctomycetaceae bacterium]|nr:sigma-70 family RNA polymerase sigma factor [Planctomycetaceae bacterium]